ncbi:MAG: hypothetical protein PHV34_04365 [Verrucomicrobiae bacterium]|nr:hypothetical protein [Verrucomicrobiae bacterium]
MNINLQWQCICQWIIILTPNCQSTRPSSVTAVRQWNFMMSGGVLSQVLLYIRIDNNSAIANIEVPIARPD